MKLQEAARISELPDDVREFILSYLRTSDAVRTITLSRNWRYSWTRAESLNIKFGRPMIREMGYDLHCRVVRNVLLSYLDDIRKIVLHHTERCSEQELNEWVLLLSRKGCFVCLS